MLNRALCVGLSVAVLALTGCTSGPTVGDGPSVTLTQSDVPINDDRSRTVACGAGALLEVEPGSGDGGSLTVQVKEGRGIPVHDETFRPGDPRVETVIDGSAGTWTLTVHRSLEYDTAFQVTLTC